MTVGVVIGIGLLGGAGALARFTLDGVIEARLRTAFPCGTLAVNLVGSFGLGVLVGAALRGSDAQLLGTGLIGAFTTFSTWIFEAHRLGEDRRTGLAALNLLLGVVLGVAVAWLGRTVGAAL